jgi:hypothetical protein
MISLNLTLEVRLGKERERERDFIGLPLYIYAPCQQHLKQMYMIMFQLCS